MTTRANIIGPVTKGDNYKWWVNIPILYGKPDTKSEALLYQEVTEETTVDSNSEEVLKNLIHLPRFVGLANVSTEDLLRYCTIASVCGIPNSLISYKQGDTVIVTFENNDMGKPIIIGSLLTTELEGSTDTKLNLNAGTLIVDSQSNVNLPIDNTVFSRSEVSDNGYKTLSMKKIEEVVKFYDALQDSGLTFDVILLLKNHTASLFPTLE